MVKLGQTLTIDEVTGKVDFEGTYDKKQYIGLTVDKKLFIYRVEKKRRKETFVKEEDQSATAYLLATWLAENIDKLEKLKN